MGYVSKDIAVITEPDTVTLAGIQNFVQFASKPHTSLILEFNLTVLATTDSIDTKLIIYSGAGEIRTFEGSNDSTIVGGNIFFLDQDPANTAENLRQALMSDPWFSSNFEIVVPFVWVGDAPVNGNVINVKAKASGTAYFIEIETQFYGYLAYDLSYVQTASDNNDSISGEENTTEIELDVYTTPAVFLGEDDKPTTPAKIGRYLTTLSKTYSGSPLWFELNALFGQYPGYTVPPSAAGWFDTGTVSIYRFIAKVRALNSFSFYQSNALYVINGYGRISDDVNLSDYVYSTGMVKLLTNKPKTPYIRGQREYLNFIFSDDQRGAIIPLDFSLRVIYRAYTTGGEYLGAHYAYNINRADLNITNTCVLNIDAILDMYPKAGNIKVALARDTAIVSNDIEYNILPECFHTLQQISFLNRLGGWDNFNFDAPINDEIKPSSVTYNKTVTPEYSIGDSQETIYTTALSNPFTIVGAPVYDDVAEWLKELAAARVLLNGAGEYIIIEDFDLKKDSKTKNMQIPTIKFRLSETYTND